MKPVIRKIQAIKDFKALIDIQRSAWAFTDLDIEPHSLMTRVQKYGGLLQGLSWNGRLVGFTYAIIGRQGGEYFLFSHMLAVRREYQGRGFGFLLKKAQRAAALKMGFPRIRWNFDPLESLNAFFNLHRLGATSSEYEVNAYGEGESGLHRGLPTDRLVATWDLRQSRVEERMRKKERACRLAAAPASHHGPFSIAPAYIEIPRDIRALKRRDPEAARRWRLKTRRLFCAAFQARFAASDVVLNPAGDRIFIELTRG